MADAVGIADRRKELYGSQRLIAGSEIRHILQTDHVLRKGELYDGQDPWRTTASDSYKGGSAERSVSLNAKDQLKTNFQLGSSEPTKQSTVQRDFTKKSAEKAKLSIPPDLHDIHLADMAPRYMEDKSFGSSLYKTDFNGKEHWNDWTSTVGPRGKMISPDERRRTTNYLRATHFKLGNDKPTVVSETGDAYGGQTHAGQAKDPCEPHSDRVASHVFRAGDYNVEGRPGNYVSIHMSDYGQQAAAGVSTVTPKAYSHVLPRESVSGSTASALCQMLQQENYNRFRNPRDPGSVNLQRAFAKYDRDRSGFITFDELKAMCLELVAQPVPDQELRDLLRECDQNEDGLIDYSEFFRFLVAQTQYIPVEGAFVSTQQDSFRGKAKSTQPQHTNTRKFHEDPVADGSYQTSTHFQFGNSKASLSSVYHGDYTRTQQLVVKPDRCLPPPSSKMTPEEPDWRIGTSVQRGDFVNHRAGEADDDVARNRERHKLLSVTLSCNPDAYKEQRQKSLTQSEYSGEAGSPAKQLSRMLPQYKYLQSDEALLVPRKTPNETEAQARFVPSISSVEIAAQKRKESLLEMKQRLKDNKQTHFPFGFDPETKLSEQKSQFELRGPVDPSVPAAGIAALPSANYSHITPSATHGNDGSSDLVTSGIQEEIQQQSYSRHVNPRDPIHMNIRMAFLEFDTDLSGKITRDEFQKVCEKYKIEIDATTLDNIMKRCDRDGDGMIDYNEFCTAFSKPSLTEETPESVMKGDYKPLQQRTFTDMQKRVIATDQKRKVHSVETHFFHKDHSNTADLSTTSNDFIKPEMMQKPKAAAL